MLKRSTIITLLLLAALVGLAFYLSRQKEKKEEEEAANVEATPAITYVFTALDGQINSIKITDQSGKTVWVERDASKAWRYTEPSGVEAEAADVEAAASQALSLRVLNTVTLLPSVVEADRPRFTIVIGFDNGKESTLKVGKVTPTGSGYYVLKENGEIVIVSKTSLESLLELFYQAPKPPTATPISTEPVGEASPTATP